MTEVEAAAVAAATARESEPFVLGLEGAAEAGSAEVETEAEAAEEAAEAAAVEGRTPKPPPPWNHPSHSLPAATAMVELPAAAI